MMACKYFVKLSAIIVLLFNVRWIIGLKILETSAEENSKNDNELLHDQ